LLTERLYQAAVVEELFFEFSASLVAVEKKSLWRRIYPAPPSVLLVYRGLNLTVNHSTS
jgi:hypothetical protein